MNELFSHYLTKTGEVGFVERVLSSLVYVEGIPSVRVGECVLFENGERGQVLAFTGDLVEIISFTATPLSVGMRVARTEEELTIPVGEELLGSLLDPLGRPLQKSSIMHMPNHYRPIESNPLPIRARARVREPCDTGVVIVDLMVPLGKGQRELVIGDQKTGKTYFLLRSLLAQVEAGSVGIYVAVGKSKQVVQEVEQYLRETKIMDRVIIVAAYAEDPASMIHIAPFSGMTIAEYFRDAGHDVIVVLDDLSMHAKMYRELSLLGRRPPGRNSYPGDIFYVHARLLERAGNFLTQFGERSITCLPVVEAALGDITGYIQTNAISMTDGHVFFDYNLFVAGRRPAINPFLSVTRVGRQTQSALRKEINQLLTSFLSSTERLETVTSFGVELSDQVRNQLEKQQQLFALFNQRAHEVVYPKLQQYLFALVWKDVWKGKPIETITKEIHDFSDAYRQDARTRQRIDATIDSASSLAELLEKAAL